MKNFVRSFCSWRIFRSPREHLKAVCN